MNYSPAATLSLVWKNFKTSNFNTKTNWESIGDYIDSYFIQYMCLWGNSTTLVYNEMQNDFFSLIVISFSFSLQSYCLLNVQIEHQLL